jgi:hypothetical protein
MQILHGTWIPQPATDFVQTGAFCLWIETDAKSRRRLASQAHPFHVPVPDLAAVLTDQLGLKSPDRRPLDTFITPRTFLLPTADDRPLPSLELSRYLETETPDSFEWQYWQIDCYQLPTLADLIGLLNNLHFLTAYNLAEGQMGADLLFWYHYTQAFKQVILRDQYIPALKYRQVDAPKGHGAQGGKGKDNIQNSKKQKQSQGLRFILVGRLSAIATSSFTIALRPNPTPVRNRQWQAWRDRIVRTQTDQPFYLYFHLQDPVSRKNPGSCSFRWPPSTILPSKWLWTTTGAWAQTAKAGEGAAR